MRLKRLIAIRKEKKISQEKMAQFLAMEQTTYSRKERGKSPLTDKDWVRIATILEVELIEIIGEPKLDCENENSSEIYNNKKPIFVSIQKDYLDNLINYNRQVERELKHLKINYFVVSF